MYRELELEITDTVWGQPGFPEENVDPVTVPDTVIVRVPESDADEILEGSESRLYLLGYRNRGSDGSFFHMPVGGSAGIIRLSAAPGSADHPEAIRDSLTVGDNRDKRVGLVADELRRLVVEFGPIPLPEEINTRDSEAESIAPPADRPDVDIDYTQPFTVSVGDLDIEFDHWFWVLLDRDVTVTVTRANAKLLTGPLVGEGAVMRQENNGDMVFLDALNTEVVRLTSQQMASAISEFIDALADN